MKYFDPQDEREEEEDEIKQMKRVITNAMKDFTKRRHKKEKTPLY